MITVIGLGCCPEDLTAAAKDAILSADKVILRTGETPPAGSVRALGVPFETLDFIYEKSRNFDTLNKNLAAEVIGAAKRGSVAYCVDGSAGEDASAEIVAKKCRNVRIIGGVSKSAHAFSAAKVFGGGASVSAYDIDRYDRAVLPLAVYDLDCDLIAGDVKLKLCEMFGDEADAVFVSEEGARPIKLYEADRQKGYGPFAALVIDRIPLLKKKRFDYEDLLEVLRLLRAPDGCPWDKVQTHESIRANMIEEAYELVDAIDLQDDAKICEETGDVLMQGAFHSVLGEERGAFTCADVLSEVCGKLIFRHSHIFGEDKASDESGALSVWEKNKREEKGQKTAGDSVSDVPKSFPAAMRAQKVGKRASKWGYDFKDAQEAAEKVKEELSELLAAIGEGDKAHICEEAGDLLFSAVNVGRLAGADCETALRESTDKFVGRFLATEALILQEGKKMEDLSPEELWSYYERAKRAHEDQKN